MISITTTRSLLWGLLLSTFLPLSLFGQCDAAIFIMDTDDFCSVPSAYSNVNAPNNDFNLTCLSGGKPVWFKFTATATAVKIEVNAGGANSALRKPRIQLLDGDACEGTITSIECVASPISNSVTLEAGGLTAGQDYLFRVAGIDNQVGTFQLCVNTFATDENDLCEGAILLPTTSSFCSPDGAYTNEKSFAEYGARECFSERGKDVWFRFRAEKSGVVITVRGLGEGGSLNRPEVQLYQNVDCDDNTISSIGCATGNISQIAELNANGLIVGNEYYIAIQGKNNTGGTFKICMEDYDPPENDLCQNATVLTDVTAFCSPDNGYTNERSNQEFLNTFNCLSSEGKDVWFQFRATQPTVKINVAGLGAGGTLLRPELALFGNNACGLVDKELIACSPANTNNEASIDIGGITVGKTYYIQVQGRDGDEGDFKLCIDNIPSPSNDDCSNPIMISEVSNYESDPREYSNINASYDDRFNSISNCLEGNYQDVWFSFIAEGTDIVITVNGATEGNFPGGSLINPEVELFGFTECGVDMAVFPTCGPATGGNLVNFKEDGLRVGDEYLIRVQGADNETGTFQLNIKNTNPNSEPESDCSDANLLCDKSPVYVDVKDGGGSDPDEASDSCWGDPRFNSEEKSSWFKWRAANSEELTFVITPDFYSDDLDWVLYELPNGLDNCNDKISLRCMASGSNGLDFSEWSICMGPTGLRSGEDDIVEDPGCKELDVFNRIIGDTDDNAFLAPIILEEGKDYALLINFFTFEFSSTEETGFLIEFGGAAEFQGITTIADIETLTDPVCVGDEVLYNGSNSSFAFGNDAISDYEWSFGAGATPATATGVGPHRVSYISKGDKNIALTVRSEAFGCKSDELIESIVDIQSCCFKNGVDASGQNTDEVCDQANGEVDLTIESQFPYRVQWNTGARDEDINNLESGTYTAIITNTADCADTVNVVVADVLPFEVMTNLTPPTCNGGADGAIVMVVERDDITFQWEHPDSTRSSLSNLAEGDYSITVADSQGCQQELVIELKEVELELDANQLFSNPSCTGLEDGRVKLNVTNGIGPYVYFWRDAIATSEVDEVPDLSAGEYAVTITDQNNCTSSLEFNLAEPDSIKIALDKQDISCEGLQDGQIESTIEGGTGNYTYDWNINATTKDLMSLDTGLYVLTVRDANDCTETANITIIEPQTIDLQLNDTEDVKCFGEETGIIRVEGIGGTPEYEFSIDGGVTFQSSGELRNLRAGTYTIRIRDQGGCSTQIEARINQPDELFVNIFADQEVVDLGKTTTLETEVSPSDRLVQYAWSNPELLDCDDCPSPSIMPLLPNNYTVTITDIDDCTATDSIFLAVRPNRELYIPNAFSPNFDGINDRFELYGGISAQEIVLLRIFDRWGNMVYERTSFPVGNSGIGWDGQYNGREAPSGVYAYYAKVRYIDGAEVEFEGDVTVIR